MDSSTVASIVVAAISVLGVIIAASIARRTTREVDGAKVQAEANAAVLGGVTELVGGLRQDRADARSERDELALHIIAITAERDRMRNQRDELRAEVARLKRQLRTKGT